MRKIINKNSIGIVYIISNILLLIYGIFYFKINNLWIMLVAIPIIIFQLIQLEHIRFDINFCFLMETFIVKAAMDQKIGRADIVPLTIAMPMLAYVFGKVIIANKNEKTICKESRKIALYANSSFSEVTNCSKRDLDNTEDSPMSQENKTIIALSSLTIGITILGLIDCILTSKSPIKSLGYYSVAFMGDKIYINKASYYFNFIFVIAVIIALLITAIKRVINNNKKVGIVLAAFGFISAIIVGVKIFVSYISSYHFNALKEGINLLITKHWGNFGYFLTYNNSTSNMWLDYGRDYGIMVFATLFIFFILTIKDAIKLVLNKNVDIFIKSWIIVLFIAINVYYFVDATAYVYPCIWYVGLIVCGMLSEVANWE